jgi:CBS domain-containing protein
MSLEGLPVTTVRDIMLPDPPRVYETDTMEKVLRVMREYELAGVPVINEGGRCVGIITDEDLVISDEESDLHLPHHFQLFGGVVFLEPLRRFEHRLRKAFATTAEDMMTCDPLTIEPEATLEDAARLIAERKHNRLPVIEHGRLVGMVTRLDVLDALTAR